MIKIAPVLCDSYHQKEEQQNGLQSQKQELSKTTGFFTGRDPIPVKYCRATEMGAVYWHRAAKDGRKENRFDF
jgi:hypothetical protein